MVTPSGTFDARTIGGAVKVSIRPLPAGAAAFSRAVGPLHLKPLQLQGLGSVDIRVNNTAPTRCSGWRRHAKAASRWTVETNRGLAAGQGWRSWAQRDGQPHVRRSGAVDCPHGQSLA